MRAKKREQQKQTSRLFLRNKEHRDLIVNDMYHNAIWVSKDGKDELAWLKYPHKYAMFSNKTYYGYNDVLFGYIDLNREFVYGEPVSESWASKIVKLKDYIVNVRGYDTTTLYITQDGVIYKQFYIGGSGGSRNRLYKFGENRLVYLYQGGTSDILTYQVYTIQNFDKDSFNVTSITKTVQTLPVNWQTPTYICATDEGCIVAYNGNRDYSTNKYGVVYYEITFDGATRLNDITTMYEQTDVNTTFGNSFSDFYYYFQLEVHREDIRDQFNYDFTCYYSRGKTNWDKEVVYSGRAWETGKGKSAIAQRGAYTYLYCFMTTETKVFRTIVGSAFTEMEIPDSVTVKIAEGLSGSATVETELKTLQLKLKDTAEDTGDIVFDVLSISDMANINDGFFNVFLEDGEIKDFEEGLGLEIQTSDRGGSRQYWYVYFDNNTFQESDGNFAILTTTFYDCAEGLHSGDYLL